MCALLRRKLKLAVFYVENVSSNSKSSRNCKFIFENTSEMVLFTFMLCSQDYFPYYRASSNRDFPRMSTAFDLEKKESDPKAAEGESFGTIFDEMPPPKIKRHRIKQQNPDGVKVDLLIFSSICSKTNRVTEKGSDQTPSSPSQLPDSSKELLHSNEAKEIQMSLRTKRKLETGSDFASEKRKRR